MRQSLPGFVCLVKQRLSLLAADDNLYHASVPLSHTDAPQPRRSGLLRKRRAIRFICLRIREPSVFETRQARERLTSARSRLCG